MRGGYGTILATNITRIAPADWHACARCGRQIVPRGGRGCRPQCEDCQDVEAFEAAAARRGVDIAEMDDDVMYEAMCMDAAERKKWWARYMMERRRAA